jgi:hypothetical protein
MNSDNKQHLDSWSIQFYANLPNDRKDSMFWKSGYYFLDATDKKSRTFESPAPIFRGSFCGDLSVVPPGKVRIGTQVQFMGP